MPQAEEFERIKTLMSSREYWVKLSVSVRNRISRWIDLYFPEFGQIFKDWTCVRGIASLKAFPLPTDLHGMTAEEVMQAWYEQGMKRAGGARGKAKAAELLREASRSIGNTRGLEEARRDLARLLNMYELLACAGDLRLYAHGRQLLRRAGLNLVESTSGKHKGQIKLSKRGDSMLRKYLYLGVVSLVGQNTDFKRMHERNQQKGMTKMASLFKCIGKLARIIIGMVQHGETYRPSTYSGNQQRKHQLQLEQAHEC